MSELMTMLSYGFIVRALVTGVLVSICAALLGVTLVLRNNAMISDGLSHVSFGAFAIAIVLGLTPLYVAIPVAMIASIFILRLNDGRLHGDSAVAIISSSALAIGVVAISVGNGVNVDMNAYLFGSILSITKGDMVVSIITCLIVLALYILSYNKIFALTFDKDFASSTGVHTQFYETILAALASLVIVLGMRMMGALLISSLTIFPTITARYLVKSYKGVMITSAVVSVICFVIGLVLSYFYSLPTGAMIVIINLIALLLAIAYAKVFRKQ
jgi:zinc transport system permease protein